MLAPLAWFYFDDTTQTMLLLQKPLEPVACEGLIQASAKEP